jgi:Predicted membrane protein/domain
MPNRLNEEIAGFWPRLAAYLLDLLLLCALLSAVRIPAFFIRIFNGDSVIFNNILFKYNYVNVLCYLAAVAYFVLLTYFTGATLGKRAMRLRVVSAADDRLRFLTVLYRETVGRYLSSILFIGYIVLAADKEKRGFHDMLCDTRVVYMYSTRGGQRQAPLVQGPLMQPLNAQEPGITAQETIDNNDITEGEQP